MRSARIVLAILSLCFIAFAFFYVPRLANCIWSDVEFTGWVAPIAERMLDGKRIHNDFTLPIPPGSFALVALIQKTLGRVRLVDELWLCALCQLAMAWIGYAMVRPFTTARNAVLATVATVPVLIATPKEIAYDHTALVAAWGSVALLAHALGRTPGAHRRWLLALAGFAASFTLAFKSSTGVGSVSGIICGLGVVSWIGYRRAPRGDVRKLARDWGAMLGGMVVGGVATAGLVLAVGGSLGEFYQAVFVDGPALKGGRDRAVGNLFSYAFFQPPVHVTLFVGLVVAYLLVRIMDRPDALQVSVDKKEELRLDRGVPALLFTSAVGLFVFVVFALAIVLLWGNADRIPFFLAGLATAGGAPAMLGLFFLVILMIANARAAKGADDRRGAFAAVVMSAGVISLMHNLSDISHRPLYDNNPIIPLVFLAMFLVLDQARATILKPMAFCAAVFVLFGPKYDRYLQARNPVPDPGFWQGMRVSNNGVELLRAARRARELAGPSGTVLMLPEDPMVEALIDRPRPKLFGAILFVDQFPEHALDQARTELRNHPPDVVLVHPKQEVGWKRVYSRWSNDSPAARLHEDFVAKELKADYRLDSSYKTWIFHDPAKLAIYVRKEKSPANESSRGAESNGE